MHAPAVAEVAGDQRFESLGVTSAPNVRKAREGAMGGSGQGQGAAADARLSMIKNRPYNYRV